jgi:SAM-dependent methyltransferase
MASGSGNDSGKDVKTAAGGEGRVSVDACVHGGMSGSGCGADDDKARAFWNGRAATFPRWGSEDNAYERGVLDTIRHLGADFRGRTVLDVGAGSGQYTLEVAREAARVVAVDVSDEMLRLSRLDAEKLGITNVDYVLSGWEGYASEAPFDVVMCMMCPAAKDDATRGKLFSLAREAVVVTGFNGYTPPPGLATALAKRGVKPNEMQNGPEMRDYLDRSKRPYRWELLEGLWRVPYTREGYMGYIGSLMSNQGVTPDAGELEAIADSLSPDGGGFVVETPYAVEVIVSRLD